MTRNPIAIARKRPVRATKRPKAIEGRGPMIQPQVDGSLRCFLWEPPSANRWWRKWRGRMVLSEEARAYKDGVATLGKLYRITPYPKGTEVRVSLVWNRSRKSGDLDKRLGVALDALQGVAYENDSQIVELSAKRDDDALAFQYPLIVHIQPVTPEG